MHPLEKHVFALLLGQEQFLLQFVQVKHVGVLQDPPSNLTQLAFRLFAVFLDSKVGSSHSPTEDIVPKTNKMLNIYFKMAEWGGGSEETDPILEHTGNQGDDDYTAGSGGGGSNETTGFDVARASSMLNGNQCQTKMNRPDK